MNVLLDECIPRKLKRELKEHTVATVTESGWSGKENGDLLRQILGSIEAGRVLKIGL